MTPEKRKEIRDAADAANRHLPFLDEFFLDEEIRRILRTPQEYDSSPLLAALKHVRAVKGWLLMECKTYVEAVRDGRPTNKTLY